MSKKLDNYALIALEHASQWNIKCYHTIPMVIFNIPAQAFLAPFFKCFMPTKQDSLIFCMEIFFHKIQKFTVTTLDCVDVACFQSSKWPNQPATIPFLSIFWMHVIYAFAILISTHLTTCSNQQQKHKIENNMQGGNRISINNNAQNNNLNVIEKASDV